MSAPDDLQLSITCLCAEWCGTCREYRAAFDALCAAHPRHRWRWLDIEDEAGLAGEDLDIETFPTLLVADAAGQVLFAGPVLPRAADAQRLIEALLETLEAGRRPAPLQLPADQLQAYAELAQRLRAAA
ncbi:MAG: thioredoxin [Aquabacterium sp.]|nr:MAG: thioredoxin [Aquabacterium sp.]